MNANEQQVLSEVANALQTALILATHARQSAGEQADEAIHVESAVERAARALAKLKPEGGTP